FSLDAGDVILTGTPKGVGPLVPGDKVRASLEKIIEINTQVVG
ncbi:fumarylacetoacetate hydrolase family protein, partial [Alteromonas australica]